MSILSPRSGNIVDTLESPTEKEREKEKDKDKGKSVVINPLMQYLRSQAQVPLVPNHPPDH
jgi:hypothetical protein